MTKEEFESQAIVCACGDMPELIKETKETLFSDLAPKEYFVCKCPMCEYMGYKSGKCKTMENAVKSWNKKVILLAEKYS